MPSVDAVMETFEAARDELSNHPMRSGQVITLPETGKVIMTGDLHDHRTNFTKLLAATNIAEHPDRHLVLHELIHGDHVDANGAEDSWQTLHAAAELFLDFPNQVHFLFANHDLAQIHGEGITKGGLDVCEAFNKGVDRDFGTQGKFVQMAMTEFLLAIPLAVRSPSGLWFSHSLPPPEGVDDFDYTVFDRDLAGPDYKRKVGPIYQLIWGRGIEPQGVAKFLEKVNAKIAITGHQPQESGFKVNGPQHLIIASDHGQGVFLPLDLGKSYESTDEIAPLLRKFVGVDPEDETTFIS